MNMWSPQSIDNSVLQTVLTLQKYYNMIQGNSDLKGFHTH